MSLTNTVLGAAFVAGSMQIAITVALPEEKFLAVHSVDYSDGHVTADRTLRWETVADWHVTLVSSMDDAPVCQTIHGAGHHEGWSKYSALGRSESSMHLDIWVGAPGCLERLKSSPGEYSQYITWAPRDDSPAVVFNNTITIEADD